MGVECELVVSGGMDDGLVRCMCFFVDIFYVVFFWCFFFGLVCLVKKMGVSFGGCLVDEWCLGVGVLGVLEDVVEGGEWFCGMGVRGVLCCMVGCEI